MADKKNKFFLFFVVIVVLAYIYLLENTPIYNPVPNVRNWLLYNKDKIRIGVVFLVIVYFITIFYKFLRYVKLKFVERRLIKKFVRDLNHSPSTDERTVAAEQLGEINIKGALKPLYRALEDKSMKVRKASAEALGKIFRAPEGKPARRFFIFKRKSPVDTKKAGKAAKALIQAIINEKNYITGRQLKFTQHTGAGVQDEAICALEKIDPNWSGSKTARQAIDGFIENLRDKRHIVRLYAVEVLGRIAPRLNKKQLGNLIDTLIEVLKEGDWDTSRVITEVLGNLGNEAVEPLVAILKDDDWRVRKNAANALGSIKDATAIKPLIITLLDENDRVRLAAEQALYRIDSDWEARDESLKAEPDLLKALKDKNPNKRNLAARVLEDIGIEPPLE